MFKGKKVLLFGLGILGGGLETAKFLLKQGARLTITDSKTRKELSPSISKLPKNVVYKLGSHNVKDINSSDIIVFNQSVPYQSEWVKKARQFKKPIFSDLSLFLTVLGERSDHAEYIAVTGTRGKTTTTTWIGHFLDATIGGNMPDRGLLKIAKEKTKLYALELSSFQLEYNQRKLLAPKIAVITNLYRDHLNRYGKMEKYAKEKAKIFLNQTTADFLILNADDDWSKFFLEQKPKAQIFWFSLRPLPKNKKGLCLDGDKIVYQDCQSFVIAKIPFQNSAKQYTLLRSLLTAYLYHPDWNILLDKIETLPQVKLRQEHIFDNGRLQVINDGAATSPDGTMALLENYHKSTERVVLITGGTNKDLEYSDWAKEVKLVIKPSNLFFLDGSATQKMITELRQINYWFESEEPKIFQNFTDIFTEIKITDKTVILFSPGAASFGLFNNEFDRSDKFIHAFKQSGLRD